MAARFEKIACPRCGHEGKPVVKGESNSLFGMVPHLGALMMAHDALNARLHCSACDEPLTRPRKDRLVEMADGAIESAATSLRCPECKALRLPGSKFCAKCGAAFL